MKRLLGLTAVLLCSTLSGCMFLGYGVRNIIHVPGEAFDEVHAKKERRKKARAAWREMQRLNPTDHSRAYKDGFLRGFEDYLAAGGNGLPPPIPPEKYQRLRYQNPQGRLAVQDWFAGFSHGSTVAVESGCREFRVMPSSSPGYDKPIPPFRGMESGNAQFETMPEPSFVTFQSSPPLKPEHSSPNWTERLPLPDQTVPDN